MTTFFKAAFSRSLGTTGKAPSFNDFSMHVGDDAESSLDSLLNFDDSKAAAVEPLHPKRTNVWQETFSPQMNSNMKHLRKDYYDGPTESDKKTVWEHIIKADTIRQVAFHKFDQNNDGLIDAADLRAELGPNANVDELIRQADKNKDGKIDQAEFCEMLKNM